MIKQPSSAPASAALWPLEQALSTWELTPECEMRCEHAVDGALARITRGLVPEPCTGELLESPLAAEAGEPGFAEAGVPRASRVGPVEWGAAVSCIGRISAVVPFLSSRAAPSGMPGIRRPLVLGGVGLALASAAALVLWLRAPALPDPNPNELGLASVSAAAPASAAAVLEVPSGGAQPHAEAPPPEGAVAPKQSTAAAKSAGTPRAWGARWPGAPQPEEVSLEPASESPSPKPGMKPAEQGTSPVDRPSPGEIHASLANVLPSAGRCLDAGKPTVPVAVTFASSGHVSSVVPGRPLTGTEQSCVVRAISQAHVSPFARLTYRVEATVHPSR